MTNPREDITIAYTLSWGTNFHIRCQFLQPTCKKSCSACTNAKWTMLWLSIRLCHSIHTSQQKIHTISYTHGTDRVARIVFREFYLHKCIFGKCQLPVCLCYGATLLHSQACVFTDTRNSLWVSPQKIRNAQGQYVLHGGSHTRKCVYTATSHKSVARQ